MHSLQRIVWMLTLTVAPCAAVNAGAGGPVRPLAQNYVTVAHSDNPLQNPLYSPSMLTLAPHKLLVSYTEEWKKGGEGTDAQVFKLSTDGGQTWKEVSRIEKIGMQGRVFRAGIDGHTLYYIAPGAGLPIYRSTDEARTWTGPVFLTDKKEMWHQTAANVWYDKGNVYLAMDKKMGDMNAWAVAERAPVLLRAKITDNLLKPSSWIFASAVNFADIIPGFRENKPDMDWFGIPFYPQDYPNRKLILKNPRKTFSPMGWCETNVVQILDPNHYWYDPAHKTYHLFMRFQSGTTNMASVMKVVEKDDGTMVTEFQEAPSGVKQLFLPMPGGQMRFHLLYDAQTKTYWLLSSQTTDSMSRPETLEPDRFDLAYQERNRLVLYFSKNMVDWCFAGVVSIGGGNRESRHYAAMDFDGDDIVILSRSGDENSHSAHETNLITFHRVKNFRDLIY